jgi:hypothetical protein
MAAIIDPKVVTNGLVLALDAADTNSYPRTGTTWTDLSGNGNNGTLTNGPTFSTTNLGNLAFNGTNQYVSVTQTLSVPITVCGYIKYIDQAKSLNTFINSFPHNTLAISLNRNGAGNLQVFIGNGSAWLGTPSINSSTTVTVNTWYYISFTCNGTTSILYLNGVNVGTSANIPSGWSTYFYLGHLTGGVSSSEYLKGNLASTIIYNRALTATEVLQNYNATKSRFGLGL